MSLNLIKKFIEERSKIRPDEELESPEAFYLLLSGIPIYIIKEEDAFENVLQRNSYKVAYDPRTGGLSVFSIMLTNSSNQVEESRMYNIRDLTTLLGFLPYDLEECRYFLKNPKLPFRERIA